jgi:3-aminobutyryl-CoA ammonia-lyase
MRKVSYLSYNMTTADANNPDGLVPVGRQFDFIGDVETEEMILVDGDESLCLGYTDVKVHEDVYVGDMMEYKATLTHIGNTSRDCRIEVFKLATPAFRAGKENCKKGDMVWFEEPVLCTEGNVRLVVKKHLQRGEQPDGTVQDPWRKLDDFPEEENAEVKDTVTYRYRMSDRDVFYGGGVVNGARSITLMGDAATRLMAKVFGNT